MRLLKKVCSNNNNNNNICLWILCYAHVNKTKNININCLTNFFLERFSQSNRDFRPVFDALFVCIAYRIHTHTQTHTQKQTCIHTHTPITTRRNLYKYNPHPLPFLRRSCTYSPHTHAHTHAHSLTHLYTNAKRTLTSWSVCCVCFFTFLRHSLCISMEMFKGDKGSFSPCSVLGVYTVRNLEVHLLAGRFICRKERSWRRVGIRSPLTGLNSRFVNWIR